MEAEVLNPQMMADVNGNGKITNAELEVLKLQELVRKLEKQNEQLRTRANAVNNCSIGPHLQTSLSCLHGGTACPSDNFSSKYGISSPTQSHPCVPELRSSTEEPFAYFQPSSVSPDAAGEDSGAAGATTVLDEVDVLDLNTVAMDDYFQLYVSPKAKLQSESVLSPLQWCRQVLDHPGPEVELAKMTLCHRLDQGTVHLPVRFPASSICSHMWDICLSELEDDSISMSYKLQDMTDVEVMARLQEESLRQDYATTSATATAGRRSSTFSLHSLRRSEMDLEEEDEEDEGYDQLPPPQPRLFRTGSMQRGSLPHSHTFSSIRDCRRSSTTPQFSLSGLSQYSGPSSLTTETHTSYRNSTDKLRRSMPNLIRAPSMPSSSSKTLFLTSMNKSAFQVPSPGQLSQRVQSVANFPTTTRHPLKATAYVSPTVQQGPTSTSLSTSPAIPRSSLPRPSRYLIDWFLSICSLLTPPKSLAALSALRDGSWKDGCY
uniref:SLAIN motif family, member 1a n=1 Tax=Lates calcarifer TaxID=8187 RepID=A0A4W6DAS0_LATCA